MSLETFLNPEGEDTALDEPTTANEVLDMVIEDWQASIRDTRVGEDDLDDDNFIPTPSISTEPCGSGYKGAIRIWRGGGGVGYGGFTCLKENSE